MFPPVYGERFRQLLTSTTADLVIVDAAGHMVPYEQSDAVIDAVRGIVGA